MRPGDRWLAENATLAMQLKEKEKDILKGPCAQMVYTLPLKYLGTTSRPKYILCEYMDPQDIVIAGNARDEGRATGDWSALGSKATLNRDEKAALEKQGQIRM